MISRLLTLSIILLGCATYGLFKIKLQAQLLSKELLAINTAIKQEKETINVLNAEWYYLNQPQRILSLSSKHLHDYSELRFAQVRYKNVDTIGRAIDEATNINNLIDKNIKLASYKNKSRTKWNYVKDPKTNNNKINNS